MIRIPRWFASWLRQWPKSARQSRQPIMLDVALAEVRQAQDARDTRRLHAAIDRAKRERTHALARELGREVFGQ